MEEKGQKKIVKKAGFTLIELMVVIFFTSVLTGITVFNYRDFDNGIEFKNQALEVALAIREAQVNALSATGSDENPNDPTSFRYSYGVFFDLSTHNNSFVSFADKGELVSPQGNFWFDDTTFACDKSVNNKECIKRYTLRSGYTITGVCVKEACIDANNGVSITFRRPDPDATIRVSTLDPEDKSSVKITLTSPKNKTKQIYVTQAGQIYIQ